MVMRSDDAGTFGTDEQVYESAFNANTREEQGATPTAPQPGANVAPTASAAAPLARIQDNPDFKALPRHIQKQVEGGTMTIEQATSVWNKQSAGQTKAPGSPQPPEQRVEPVAPQGQKSTSPQESAYRGRPGLSSEDISEQKTFAAPGTREATRRGFSGAVFSPLSIFGSMANKMGAFDRQGAQGPTPAGALVGGNTLVASSPSLGGGIPIDGGLAPEDQLQGILGQMLQTG
jgi:hypothetical protein